MLEETLSPALEAFAAALGPEAVLTSAEELAEFRDPFWPADDDTHAGSAVVMPTTTEQVQAVVRIAGEHGIPLWTHSTGRNNGYGGPAPRVGGSVVVSLRNMNHVLEIDDDLAYAVVEPGVRWFDLYDALQAGGHELMVSIPDLGWGSAVGNSLDNGVTYLNYGRDFRMVCGMEIVLADGSLLRTGMGAMEGNPAWHTYKRGLGPVLDPLFMQSNYGIVTRMGVWLQRRPECYLPAAFKLWREEDIDRGLEIVRDLMMDGVMDGVPNIFNTLISASVLATRSDYSTDPAPLDDAMIDTIARDLDVGRWAGRFALYGDEDMVDLKLARIRRAFAEIPGAEVTAERKFLRGEFDRIERSTDRIQFGIPDLEVDNITGWYNQAEGGHIGFSPVVPLKAENVREVRTMLRTQLEEVGLDFLVGLLTINERSVIMVTMVLFDTTDEEMTRRAYDACRGLVAEAGRRGYGEYRAHLSFMDLAQEQYAFGDNAYRRFCETIKDAVDPKGILAPGRHGIWPANMREGR
jgi:4-cresol dehydrogenase (hydroxylating) flavoprotein subunit